MPGGRRRCLGCRGLGARAPGRPGRARAKIARRGPGTSLPVDPDRKRLRQVLAAGGLHRALEVAALDALPGVSLRVASQAVPECAFAERTPQQIEEQRSLRVRDGALDLLRRLLAGVRERKVEPSVDRVLPTLPGEAHLALVVGAPPPLLLVGGDHERRDAFIEPEVLPRCAGDEVPPPSLLPGEPEGRFGRALPTPERSSASEAGAAEPFPCQGSVLTRSARNQRVSVPASGAQVANARMMHASSIPRRTNEGPRLPAPRA